ncbi:MAG: PDC sensor domain-containing protein, partial [Burkholderiales bacterium]|nr:PDC sensor domain-containing protein [Burkholderiales bacterium]
MSDRAAPLDMPAGPARRLRHEWLWLAAVLLAMALFGVWTRYAEYRRLEVEQDQLLAAQVRAIDADLTRQLVGARAAMAGLRDDLRVWPADDIRLRADRRLKSLVEAIPGLSRAVLVDGAGRVTAASRSDLLGHGLGARAEALRRLVSADPRRLVLSPPYAARPGHWTLDLALAVPQADAGYGGAIVATLDTAALRELLRATMYAPDMVALVAHGDGALLMLEPDRPGVAGQALARLGAPLAAFSAGAARAALLTGRIP